MIQNLVHIIIFTALLSCSIILGVITFKDDLKASIEEKLNTIALTIGICSFVICILLGIIDKLVS